MIFEMKEGGKNRPFKVVWYFIGSFGVENASSQTV